MGLLKSLRSKTGHIELGPGLKSPGPRSPGPKSPGWFSGGLLSPGLRSPGAGGGSYFPVETVASIPARTGPDLTLTLPDHLLSKIIVQVCPHAQDNTYDSSEQSAVGDGCILCDSRDLARCARVCRKWYNLAQDQLYHSVRIDAVHYCELEDLLLEKRQRKTLFRPHAEAGDIPAVRLTLLCRTVRESPALAARVEIVKLPYMTRETCKGDLARTLSALPNLRYADLPDGVSTGDADCMPLMHELQGRCTNIRKMSFKAGSEASVEQLTRGNWDNLEILELSGVALEPSTLRLVLGSLPSLRHLTLRDIPNLDDSIFLSSPEFPEFPTLQSLSLENIPHMTSQGLQYYLSHPHIREMLSSLTLNTTGVAIQALPTFLWDASALTTLTFIASVSRSIAFNLSELPPLTSLSLQVLHYEITDSDDAHGLQRPSQSYYAYLAKSLSSNSLPALAQLYVREPSFAESLTQPTLHPTNPFTHANTNGASRSFNQPLEIFSKGADELDWVFTSISPSAASGAGFAATSGRPNSGYSAGRGSGSQWAGGETRKSVIVGNGHGGFRAVPQDDGAVFGFPGAMVGAPPASMMAGNPKWATSSVVSAGSNRSDSTTGWFRQPPSIVGSVASAGSKANKADLWR